MKMECRMQNAAGRLRCSEVRTTPHATGFSPRAAAFTMIEIAISLAIIGFALVAILGVLPLGMSVQRENREETIINQDASMLMEAIRSGTLGMDDLTNYVLSATVAWTDYDVRKRVVASGVYGYIPTNMPRTYPP